MRDEYILTGEAARVAKSSDDTIRRAFDAGLLEGVRLENGLRLVNRASVEAYAQEREAQRIARRRSR